MADLPIGAGESIPPAKPKRRWSAPLPKYARQTFTGYEAQVYERALKVARERTDGLAQSWVNWAFTDGLDLNHLIACAYLQGVQDAAFVSAKMRIERCEGVYEEER